MPPLAAPVERAQFPVPTHRTPAAGIVAGDGVSFRCWRFVRVCGRGRRLLRRIPNVPKEVEHHSPILRVQDPEGRLFEPGGLPPVVAGYTVGGDRSV